MSSERISNYNGGPLHRRGDPAAGQVIAPDAFELREYAPGALGRSANDVPGYQQIKQVQARPRALQLAVGVNAVPLVVQEPTLVKIVSCALDSGVIAASGTFRWHRLGAADSDVDFYGLTPFFGPYAWLPIPGEYELLLNLNTASAARLVTMAVTTGLDPLTVQMLLDPARSHFWQSEVTTLAAGVPAPIWSEPARWPSYKRIIVSNASATGVSTVNLSGSAFALNMGSSGTTGQGGPGAGAFTIDPEFLGRSTVTMVSANGGDVRVAIAQW